MSLETLHAAQESVAREIGVGPDELRQMQETRVHRFLLKTSTGLEVPAVRVHCGVLDAGAKGGIRYDDNFESIDELEELGEELAGEMAGKTAVWDLYRNGGKAVIGGSARDPLEERTFLMRQFARQMHEAGLGDYRRDSPAGDIGSNGLSDIYAEVMRDQGDNPYWKASITGKTPEMGGLDFRPAATGWGAYVTNVNASRMVDHPDVPQTVKIQGFGNVGSYQAHFSSEDSSLRVVAVSDAQGTLVMPEGMEITSDMIHDIGDNKEFTGDKMAALAEAIEKRQGVAPEYISHNDDKDAIYKVPANWFVPAAMPNVVNAHTIPLLESEPDAKPEEKFLGVIESGNGVTTADGHSYLVENGYMVTPDIVTNGGGVGASMEELEANVAEVDSGAIRPSEDDVKRSVRQGATSVLHRVERMADELETPDLRKAAAAVQIAVTAFRAGAPIDARFERFLTSEK